MVGSMIKQMLAPWEHLDKEVNNRLVWQTTFIVFVLATLATFGRQATSIAADELGYLSQAQLVAGKHTVGLSYSAYYHYGYSLLLAPWAALFSSPSSIYRAAMVTNAGLLALVVPVLMQLSRFLAIPQTRLTLLTAALAAMWPSHWYVTHYAWSESAFRLAFVLTLLATAQFLSTPKLVSGALFSFSMVATYAIHPRALPLIPVSILLMGMMAIQRKVSLRVVMVNLLLVAALTAAFEIGKRPFLSEIWGPGFHTHPSAVGDRVRSLQSLHGLKSLVLATAGQIWYQIAASLGLVVLGAWSMLSRVRSKWAEPAGLWSLFVLLAILGMGSASIVQMLFLVRLDHLVYGRYNDGATLVLLWLGAVAIAESGPLKTMSRNVLMAGVLACGCLAFLMIDSPKLLEIPLVTQLTAAIKANIGGLGGIDFNASTGIYTLLARATGLAMVGGGLLVCFSSPRSRLALCLLFVIVSDIKISEMERGHHRSVYKRQTKEAKQLLSLGASRIYWNDAVQGISTEIYHLQFFTNQIYRYEGSLKPGEVLLAAKVPDGDFEQIATIADHLIVVANRGDFTPLVLAPGERKPEDQTLRR